MTLQFLKEEYDEICKRIKDVEDAVTLIKIKELTNDQPKLKIFTDNIEKNLEVLNARKDRIATLIKNESDTWRVQRGQQIIINELKEQIEKKKVLIDEMEKILKEKKIAFEMEMSINRKLMDLQTEIKKEFELLKTQEEGILKKEEKISKSEFRDQNLEKRARIANLIKTLEEAYAYLNSHAIGFGAPQVMDNLKYHCDLLTQELINL